MLLLTLLRNSATFLGILGFAFLFFSFFFIFFFLGGRVLCLGSTAGVLDGYCQFGLDYC